MKHRITVEIDEADLREALEDVMDDRVAEAKAEAHEEAQERAAELMAELKADLLDARRMLLRAQPSPAEALIYLERAIVVAEQHA